MEEPIVGDRSAALAATIAVLCEGLRPEAHAVMAEIVESHIGPDMTFIAVGRRILDNYDIVVAAQDFVEALRAYMAEYLTKLVFAYRAAPDPQVEALSALTGFFIVTHPDLMKPARTKVH